MTLPAVILDEWLLCRPEAASSLPHTTLRFRFLHHISGLMMDEVGSMSGGDGITMTSYPPRLC
jgi:hypothetical protein